MANNVAASLPQDAARIGSGRDALRLRAPESTRAEPPPMADSAIAVPLQGDGDIAIGAIALYDSKHPGDSSPEDRALLRLISTNAEAAVRLHRTRLGQQRSDPRADVGRSLSGLLHDMRTPLAVIGGYVQLMAQTPDAAQRAEHAQLVLSQLDLLRGMQREVLELARAPHSP